MDSWLPGTVNCLNYFGSCLGRAKLVSLPLWGSFLTFYSYLQFERRKYLTELHVVKVDVCWNVLLSSVFQFKNEWADETSSPSPVCSFACLLLSQAGRVICAGEQWQSYGKAEECMGVWTTVLLRTLQGIYTAFPVPALLKSRECHPCCNFMLLSDKM